MLKVLVMTVGLHSESSVSIFESIMSKVEQTSHVNGLRISIFESIFSKNEQTSQFDGLSVSIFESITSKVEHTLQLPILLLMLSAMLSITDRLQLDWLSASILLSITDKSLVIVVKSPSIVVSSSHKVQLPILPLIALMPPIMPD